MASDVPPNRGNPELAAFVKHKASLTEALTFTIDEVANNCRAEGLIGSETYDMLFDGRWTHNQRRSRCFVNYICKRLKIYENSPENEKLVASKIKLLADIIGKESGALTDTANLIVGCRTCEELEKNSPAISTAISNTLNTVVSAAYSNGLITHEESSCCLLPNAQHEKFITNQVLSEVETCINLEPSKLYIFLKILQKIGNPISLFVTRIKSEPGIKSEPSIKGQ
jgi:hypothetical protein